MFQVPSGRKPERYCAARNNSGAVELAGIFGKLAAPTVRDIDFGPDAKSRTSAAKAASCERDYGTA